MFDTNPKLGVKLPCNGERKVENLSLKTAIALASALGVGVEEMR